MVHKHHGEPVLDQKQYIVVQLELFHKLCLCNPRNVYHISCEKGFTMTYLNEQTLSRVVQSDLTLSRFNMSVQKLKLDRYYEKLPVTYVWLYLLVVS